MKFDGLEDPKKLQYDSIGRLTEESEAKKHADAPARLREDVQGRERVMQTSESR